MLIETTSELGNDLVQLESNTQARRFYRGAPISKSFDPLPEPGKWPGANARLLGLGTGLPVPPLQRLAQFSPADFERFTLEWANGYLKPRQNIHEVQLRAGSGDKGRDVVAWLDPPTASPRRCRIYQCKHYSSRLGLGTAAAEIGKLIYYTSIGDFPGPEEYHFVTHLGVTGDLQDHLDDPEKLKIYIQQNWDEKCAGKIKSGSVQLVGGVLEQFESIDFSIFRAMQPLDIITEHAETPYHLAVFGAPLLNRPPPKAPPSQVAAIETPYISELMRAISQSLNGDMKSETDIPPNSPMAQLFSRSRLTFYSAEGLRELSRDQMADSGYFISLLDEFENGLYYYFSDSENVGVSRLKNTVKGAQSLQLGSHVLAGHINAIDREGMCHHLVNDRNVKWCE